MEARYLYSVVRTDSSEALGNIGIEEKNVYTIPYKDVAAVVHCCQPVPYETKDKQLAEEWLLEHSYVIDQATTKFGTVLPFSFDVLIKGDDSVVREWLLRSYDHLKTELCRLEDRAEYSIQIYYDRDKLAAQLIEEVSQLKKYKNRIDCETKGKAYLLQRNLELKVKDLICRRTAMMEEKFSSLIRPLTDELKPQKKSYPKAEKYKGKTLLASYICLASNDHVDCLGEVLDEINNTDGFTVRFTGPWAPFNFVCLEAV
jgi:hypothetical protein